MLRFVVVVAAMTVCASCALDPHRQDRPAQLRLGTNARHFTASTPTASSEPLARVGAVQRAPVAAGAGESTTTVGHEAITGSAQFTMTAHRFVYLGGELEAGKLENAGSNVAGAYAVAGAQHTARYGSLGVEVVGGWRQLRYSLDEDPVSQSILEPRVRGELWLSPQVTFGAKAGATLGEQGAWMAGIYLGFHSKFFDVQGY
jgi:hypothetical protein